MESKHLEHIDIQNEKQELRDDLNRKFNLLTDQEKLTYAVKVFHNLFNIPHFIKTEEILLYYSFHKLNEVPTISLLETLVNYKKIYLPKIINKNNDMEFFHVENLSTLKPNYLGILEPTNTNSPYKNNTGSIIIPGLGFDKDGNRLGKGKGFYDKYLANKNLTKIGICFDFQIQPYIPTTQYDQKMDYIVSEKNIINTFKKPYKTITLTTNTPK